MITAVIELTPESILDIAAANMAETTRARDPGGKVEGYEAREDLVSVCGQAYSGWQLARFQCEVTQQGKAHQGQENTDTGPKQGPSQVGLPSGAGIPGSHESLDTHLVPTCRADLPDQNRQDRPHYRHPNSRIEAEKRLGIPGGLPSGGEPTETVQGDGDEHYHQEGSSQEKQGLQKVGNDHRSKPSERGVDDRNETGCKDDKRDPLFAHAQHDRHRRGSDIHQ